MICGMTYFQICLYFLIYSFGGWVVEVIFHAVALGKVINRGFLNGPVCPVYGFGVVKSSYDTLLQEGEYTKEEKLFKKKTDTFSGVYWCLTTAIYLAWSFWTMSWDITWIVWPVAGVLFAALLGVVKMVLKNSSETQHYI